MFMDHVIKTDEASQAKITGTLMMMSTGAVDTIDFKSATGWLTLDKDNFTKLAMTVATHVQVCFSAESALIETLNEKSLEELLKLDPENISSIADMSQSTNKKTIYDLYEEQYTIYIQAAEKAQLKKAKGK